MLSGLILTESDVSRIRGSLARFDWYRRAQERMRTRVEELIERAPEIPIVKGRAFYESCTRDSARLIFDPYRPSEHRCPRCGLDHTGEEFDLAWVRQFQDWLAKRLVEAGILYALEGDERHARLVRDSLRHFIRHYRDYPLANNLLGPTRLFQSTYLEAFWLVDIVAAYDLTRASSAYSASDHGGVRDLLYESCEVVRSYDEGVSNRQAFNNAGMGAVGLLYEDAELVEHVLDGPHGFAFHMRESLLEDGIWYEGENYHFATLDHTLNLAEMARHRGIDLYHGTSGYGSLRPMFDGPLKVMLPDLTFPSRKDSWFGRGIGYHKDVYELGYARYGDERYGGLLAHAYESGDSDREELGWRTFLYLSPELPEFGQPDRLRPKGSEPMPGTGVAVLRHDDGAVYASAEYGHYGGGHGHPDRLHLTLFADGVHWLLDPGTGWYHVPELGWYRSTIAHNTITVDGRPQLPNEGTLETFGSAGGFAVAQTTVTGLAPGVARARRTLVLGEGFLLDVLDVHAERDGRERQLDWAFHTPGSFEVPQAGPESGRPGRAVELGARDGYEFLGEAHEVRPQAALDLTARLDGSALRVVQLAADEPVKAFTASAPGVPGREESPLSSLIVRRTSAGAERFATLWLWGENHDSDDFRFDSALDPDAFVVEMPGRTTTVSVPAAAEAKGADGRGVAIVSTRGAGREAVAQTVAWFGTSGFRLCGIEMESDLALPWAAVVRGRDEDGHDWTSQLPEEFGRLALRGIGKGGSLVFVQPAGRNLWRDEEGPLRLFAGCENEIEFTMGGYGVQPAEPAIELPAGWRKLDLQRVAEWADSDARVERWRLRLLIPSDSEIRRGELSVSRRFGLPFEVSAPVATSWRVRSFDGEPAAELEVRDLRGRGGELRVWLTDSPKGTEPLQTIEPLPPGGSARVRLPLPGRAPGAGEEVAEVASESAPAAEVAGASTGRGAGEAGREERERLAPAVEATGVDDLDPASPRGLSGEEGWPLPGMTGSSGDHLLTARIELDRFSGVSSARLPLAWTGAGPESIRLDRVDQALWADRPWRGSDDARAHAGLRLEEDGLRLTCRVWDDLHVTDANRDDPYENDSVQVYFDFREDHHGDRNFSEGVAAYVLAPSAEKDSVAILPIAGNREISNRGARAEWFTATGVTGHCRPAEGGYELDVHFPFASMGAPRLRPGAVIGFDLALSDNDGTWYRNTQLLWSGSRGRRCYIRGSYHNPMEFGWLVVST